MYKLFGHSLSFGRPPGLQRMNKKGISGFLERSCFANASALLIERQYKSTARLRSSYRKPLE